MPEIRVTPLGAGQDVGRSCILVSIAGKNVMLDCGMHMGFSDDRRFPDFSYITRSGRLTDFLDCVIISHFHLDHCGALPYFSEMVGYDGPIYMTQPTQAICPILLEDYRKIAVDKKVVEITKHIHDNRALRYLELLPLSGTVQEPQSTSNAFTPPLTHWLLFPCILIPSACETPGTSPLMLVDDELEIKAYYAGHVLGAAMFQIKVGSESVVYTGDYNMTPDRHLGAAWIDKCRPNLLITESTYATTIRDSKRCRERDFLKKVHETVERGGKVLIPVFALGRAQELCILLETFWERMDLKAPIYFSTGLTEKANHYYKLFIPWTNQKIRKTFVQRNMFEFKHIKAFDRAFADSPGPMVVFATPGMLHAGQSLQIFRKWAGNEKNMVIMPGYCVQGTVGHKILSGQRKLEMEGRQVLEVKMQVEYMSFSAHADAKGIMQLVGQAEPENVLLVHGEAKKMEFLKQKIEQEFRVSCYMPANGETVTLPTSPSIPVGISLGLLKREMAQGLLPDSKKPRLLHGTLIMKDSNFRLVSSEQALKELGLAEHQLRFTCRVHLHDTRKEQETAVRVYSHLKSVLKDHCVQHLPDGSVTVESILIQAAAHSEDPGTKVLLVSWTYQDEELGSYLTSLLKKGLPQAS
ncbi:integrator complex subunit 11 isoform X1 [Sagmatias obliquidens]|uniref:integrator complex subunit 11 isoform X1 n=1 Tax=Sagmatias obliquidens TaxID=3371155 RepID=UPI000F443C8B|nr:integrator complex subunit 11 isoform X1 [Lagenorhynchus obliquidens]